MPQVNARDIVVEVESATPDTWVAIAGLTSHDLNLAANEEFANTTTYDSDGHFSQAKMQVGATLTVTGMRIATSGTQDPGQLRCEVLAAALDTAGIGTIRYHYPSETTWKIWDCTVSLGSQAGGTNDKTGWSATFTRVGAPTTGAVS